MARTRPFVKVHLSVADHRKTAAVWADPRMRGMLVELWRKACEKYAGHLGDRVMLKPTDRMEIAGTTDQREADEAVSSLCRALKYRLTRHPNRWEAHIRKFSKKQGFENKELDKNSTTSPASETPIPKLRNSETPNAEREREFAPSAPAADAAPRSPRRSLVGKPESFPPESKERLREWAERKGYDRSLLNAGLDAFRDWVPQKPPYRRTLEQWEGAFKKILREGVADGKFGKSETKPRAAYRRDDSGQVLVPNEWRGLAG